MAKQTTKSQNNSNNNNNNVVVMKTMINYIDNKLQNES